MWLLTGLSLIGVWLNVKKRNSCFLFFIVTNTCWAVYDFSIGAVEQGFLFCVYFLLSVYGLWEWSREKSRHNKEKGENGKEEKDARIKELKKQLEHEKKMYKRATAHIEKCVKCPARGTSTCSGICDYEYMCDRKIRFSIEKELEKK